MAIALVQSAGNHGSAGAATTTISASGSGNKLIAIIDWNVTAQSVTGLTDNKGNTWHQQTGAYGNVNYSTDIWYTDQDVASGVTSVAVTSAISGFVALGILEFSGCATGAAETASHTSGSSSTWTSPALTTSTANDVIVFGGSQQFGWTTYNAPGNQAPADPAYGVMGGELGGYYIVSGTVTSSTTTVTCAGNGPFGASAAAFKPATGAAGQHIPFPWDHTSGGMQNINGGMRS